VLAAAAARAVQIAASDAVFHGGVLGAAFAAAAPIPALILIAAASITAFILSPLT
jgi:hypothetical protein